MIDDFFNENATKFKPFVKYYIERLKECDPNGFIYICSGGFSQGPIKFREKVANELRTYGYKNVATVDDVMVLSDQDCFSHVNAVLANIAHQVGGLVIEIDYHYWEKGE